MGKKKVKRNQFKNVSKWIETQDGTFSLVIDSKKQIYSQKYPNNQVN